MKTKILMILLTLTVTAACFAACTNDGNNDTPVTTDTESVATEEIVVKGGEISVVAEVADGKLTAKVNLANNPGIAGFNIRLGFDNTKLRPVEFTGSEIIDHNAIVSNIQMGEEYLDELTFVSAVYPNPSDFNGNGNLFTLVFDIREGASGETELTLDCNDITNELLQDMEFTTGNCTVALD